MAASPARGSTGGTIRFSLGLSIVLVGLVTVQLFGFMAQRGVDRVAARRIELTRGIEQIRYYDELLTMSARVAAATGEASYVRRYNEAVPKLDAVIADAFTVAPDAVALAALGKTDAANQALIALEADSLALLAAGNNAGAYDLLTSQRYAELKATYADGMHVALTQLDRSSADAVRRTNRHQAWILAGGGLAAAALAVLWFRTAVSLNRSRKVRERIEEQLRVQASADPLTGLANRRLFRQRLSDAFYQPERGPIAVLFADLDHFKTVNDTHGHADGDWLLTEVSERMRDTVETVPGALVARLGGDEFAILLPDADTAAAEAIAARLVAALGLPYAAAAEAPVSVSVGVAVAEVDADEPGTVLRGADLAMYAAKDQGRGRWVSYAPQMHTDLVHRVELEAALRSGLSNGEVVVHYQPTFDLTTRRPRGVEALARWQHPHRGLLGPDLFVPVAENAGMIVVLGRIVLEEACRQLVEWRSTLGSLAPTEVAVNVSPQELHQVGFVRKVEAILGSSGLPAASLVLEVTEGTFMRDIDAVVDVLADLRRLGVRIAMDDFGMGYSSLSRLNDLPLDAIKIDRSFVQDAERNQSFLELMITLAARLDVEVVAEGIETEKQLATLLELGCRYGQGYLLNRPLDVAATTALFALETGRDGMIRADVVAGVRGSGVGMSP